MTALSAIEAVAPTPACIALDAYHKAAGLDLDRPKARMSMQAVHRIEQLRFEMTTARLREEMFGR
jgi:hypothetical protein